jgi:para-nitrobenzyl esterase
MKSIWILFLLLVPSCFGEIKNAIRTEAGLVSGIAGRDPSITAFKGIPYAEPPVGELRWTAPRPKASWTGVRSAAEFGSGCAQTFASASFPKSEDCLYLNIWTPAQSGSAALPVMVWIHGGGLVVGSTSEPLYDGEELAKKGVVVVTINYRLSIFGFFAHPELGKESTHDASGNYGFLDQIAALQWVKRNIAAFGGDANKVTIFGQSAGGRSVIALMASPLSKGLFRAAISESGGGFSSSFPSGGALTLQESELIGVKFAESLKAKSIADLRKLPANTLLRVLSEDVPGITKTAGVPISNEIDGYFFPESLAAIFGHGNQNKVPMLIGSNSDEGQHLFRNVLPVGEYLENARKMYGDRAEQFLKLYPGQSEQLAKTSQQLQFADRTAAGARELAVAIQKSGNSIFLYLFSHLDTGNYNSEPPGLGLMLGADHGAELPYVFGLLNHWKAAVPENDRILQDRMMSYWTNFAKNLDPNGAGLPVWKPFNEKEDAVMSLEDDAGMKPHPREEQIRFIQSNVQK